MLKEKFVVVQSECKACNKDHLNNWHLFSTVLDDEGDEQPIKCEIAEN